MIGFINNSKRPWLIRFAILGGLLAAWLLANALLVALERHYSKPITLNFNVPLPDDIVKIFGVTATPDIEKVIVAGFFSDWAEDGPYEMRQVSPTSWTIDIQLPLGNNQYKYVAFIRDRKDPVWVYDTTNPNRVLDTWGEHNSIINIPNIPSYAFIVHMFFTSLLALLVISFFIEPIIHRILHWRFSFHIKLMISMVIFVTLSNIVFMIYHLHESRQLIKQGIIDNINMIHMVLSGRDVNFKNIANEKENLHKALADFFWDSKTRVEKYQSSPYQITLSDLAVLDANYQLIYLSHRNQNAVLQAKRAQKLGFKNTTEFFMQGIFSPAIAESKKQLRLADIIFNHPKAEVIAAEPLETRRGHFFLGYSTFLKPIIIHGKHVGFYAGAIQSKLFGKEIERMFYISCALVLIISALCLFLLASVGKLITRHLTELALWTQEIIKGNFNSRITIKSGDEIQLLAENFDAMRGSLEESFSQIAEKNDLLLREAYYDSLTGLPNRKKMTLDLTDTPSKGLFVINIDSFRGLNDFFGTDVGDCVLREVTVRLAAMTTAKGLELYKIGPDEFVITLGNISYPVDIHNSEQVQQFCRDICRKITDYCYQVGNNEIYISVTAGIAIDQEQSLSKALFSHATNAMRIAKESLAGQLMYDKNMEEVQAFEYNMTWASKVKQAIDEDRIVPFFQPIVTNDSGHIGKYECLVRLLEKDGSIVAPYMFLGIAMQARLYPFITQIMVRKSFAVFANNDYEFTINISIEDLLNQQTMDCIFSTIALYPFAAERAVFEITESAEIKNYEIVRNFIKKIKTSGCRIAIDDFGSGYSNFLHIMSLQVDFLKIDGSLIRYVADDKQAQIIVRTIAEFAKNLGIKTIAEFVHSEAVYLKTLEYGIDFSQGYYFGKPEATLVDVGQQFLNE